MHVASKVLLYGAETKHKLTGMGRMERKWYGDGSAGGDGCKGCWNVWGWNRSPVPLQTSTTDNCLMLAWPLTVGCVKLLKKYVDMD